VIANKTRQIPEAKLQYGFLLPWTRRVRYMTEGRSCGSCRKSNSHLLPVAGNFHDTHPSDTGGGGGVPLAGGGPPPPPVGRSPHLGSAKRPFL